MFQSNVFDPFQTWGRQLNWLVFIKKAPYFILQCAICTEKGSNHLISYTVWIFGLAINILKIGYWFKKLFGKSYLVLFNFKGTKCRAK